MDDVHLHFQQSWPQSGGVKGFFCILLSNVTKAGKTHISEGRTMRNQHHLSSRKKIRGQPLSQCLLPLVRRPQSSMLNHPSSCTTLDLQLLSKGKRDKMLKFHLAKTDHLSSCITENCEILFEMCKTPL